MAGANVRCRRCGSFEEVHQLSVLMCSPRDELYRDDIGSLCWLCLNGVRKAIHEETCPVVRDALET